MAPIPEEERGELLAAYYRRLTGADPAIQLACAAAWAAWEGSLITLLPDPALAAEHAAASYVIATARLGAHYLHHRGWLETEDQLLRGVARIAHLPARIVHGRYDLACPPRAALDLHRAWPGSQLTLVPDGGHSAWEPAMAAALRAATDAFARRLFGERGSGRAWEVDL